MALFKSPQKKQRWKSSNFQPLPIEGHCVLTSTWSYFDGYLEEGYVLVKRSGDVASLSMQGFFGKRIGRSNNLDKASCEEETKCEKDVDDVLKIANSVQGKEDVDNVLKIANSVQGKEDVDDVLKIANSVQGNEDVDEEELCLSFEESFFLSFGIGCLFVHCNNLRVEISQQWNEFRQRSHRFPFLYATYHHFRSKGWVPKEGVRYGADMVLYKKGPPFYHASYIVAVQSVYADTLKPVSHSREMGWATLSGLLRLATTVSKEVMLCYVKVPRDITDKELSSPNCLKRFQIHETLLSRWVSSKQLERELTDVDCEF